MDSDGALEQDRGGALPLLERTVELSRLDGMLEEVSGGGGSSLLIEGEPGIGKTRLLSELARTADRHGFTVLRARASELERSYGFGVVHQLFDPCLRDPDQARELLTGAARLSTPAFPHLSAVESIDETSYATLHGLYWLAANIADRAPTALLIDDLQWTDEPSLRFVSFLATRLAGTRMALVAATRLGSGVAIDNRRGDGVLRLGPLGRDAVGELVAERLGDEHGDGIAGACERASGGNPFLLTELIEELRWIGAEQLDAGQILAIGPERVARAVRERSAAIPGGEELARALAVLGDGSPLAAAAELAGLEPGESSLAADRLADAHILAPGRPLGFVHPTVRAAVYDAIGAARLGEMHGRAARQLEDRGAAAEAVSMHLLRSEPRGDPRVVARLRAVAREAIASGAPEMAVELLQRALEEGPDGAEHGEVLAELGRALAISGSAQASAVLEAALDTVEDGPVRIGVAMTLSGVLQIGGELERALDVLERVRPPEILEGDPFAAIVDERMVALACSAVGARRHGATALERAREVVRSATSPRPELLASIAFDTLLGGGEADRARELALRSLEGSALQDTEMVDAPYVIGAGNTLFLSGAYEPAQELLDELVVGTRRQGAATQYGLVLAMRSWQRRLVGDLRGAESDASASLELHGDAAGALLKLIAVYVLAEVRLDRGEASDAAAALELAARFSEDDDLGFAQLVHIARSRSLLERDNAPAAAAALEPCRRFEQGWGPGPGIACIVPWRPAAARALSALGDPGGARALSAEQLELARSFGVPHDLGEALREAGVAEGGARGLELIEESIEILDGSGARMQLARSLVAHGMALRRHGSRTLARERLTAGMDLAHRIGAVVLAQRARDELVTAGARPRRLAASGPDSLTAAERRVARHAARGMLNREIAQALFVTLRTVEGHLSNAFRKLDISSRSELTDALAEPGEDEATSQAGPGGAGG